MNSSTPLGGGPVSSGIQALSAGLTRRGHWRGHLSRADHGHMRTWYLAGHKHLLDVKHTLSAKRRSSKRRPCGGSTARLLGSTVHACRWGVPVDKLHGSHPSHSRARCNDFYGQNSLQVMALIAVTRSCSSAAKSTCYGVLHGAGNSKPRLALTRTARTAWALAGPRRLQTPWLQCPSS